MTSFVSQDSAWLQIDDMAIETGTTGIDDERLNAGFSLRRDAAGKLVVQGTQNEELQLTLRDIGGRVVQRASGPSPVTLDGSSGACGIYVLSVTEASRSCSVRVVW